VVAAVAARLGPHALAGEGFERSGCDARPAQVVVAGVTCGDAPIPSSRQKIRSHNAKILKSAVIGNAKGCQRA